MARKMYLLRAFCHLDLFEHSWFPNCDISHADSLTDLIRLIEQVRSTPREERGIY